MSATASFYGVRPTGQIKRFDKVPVGAATILDHPDGPEGPEFTLKCRLVFAGAVGIAVFIYEGATPEQLYEAARLTIKDLLLENGEWSPEAVPETPNIRGRAARSI